MSAITWRSRPITAKNLLYPVWLVGLLILIAAGAIAGSGGFYQRARGNELD